MIRISYYEVLQATSGFVQLGHDVEAIIGSAYPGFIFGGRNSGKQVDSWLIPQLHKASNIRRHALAKVRTCTLAAKK